MINYTWTGEKKNFAGDREGFSNPGIYTFAGNKVGGFIREMIQNSLDAGNRIDSEQVSIRISMRILKTEDFPNFQQWKGIIDAAVKENPSKDGISILKALEQDLKRYNGVPVLVYEDFNTPGLSGKKDTEGTFNALVRSNGTSEHDKPATAGGSYGIGKNAAWSMSKVRTVIFSSYHNEDGDVLQGIAALASHKVGGLSFGAKVYFGQNNAGCSGIRDLKPGSMLYETYSRKGEPGLTQFIMFPQLSNDWRNEISSATLRNYWPAIEKGFLSVKVIDESKGAEGLTLMDSTTINDLMNRFFGPNEYRKNPKVKPKGNPLDFWKCRKEGKSLIENVTKLGQVKYEISLDANHSESGVCFIRRGMVIYVDTIWGFGSLDYCVTVECLERKGNEYLRGLEPPTHDDFSHEIAQTRAGEAAGKEARKVLKGLEGPIRRELSEYLENQSLHTNRIGWVDELFQAIESNEGTDGFRDSNCETKSESPKRLLSELKIQQITFDSAGMNTALINDANGEKEDQSGGNNEGTGSGKVNSGQDEKAGSENDVGGGPLEGRNTKLSQIPHRIYSSGSTGNDHEYTIVTSLQEDNGDFSCVLSQKGDKGKVAAFDLLEVRGENGESLVYTSIGEKGFLIKGMPANGQVKIVVREGYKSNFILTHSRS